MKTPNSSGRHSRRARESFHPEGCTGTQQKLNSADASESDRAVPVANSGSKRKIMVLMWICVNHSPSVTKTTLLESLWFSGQSVYHLSGRVIGHNCLIWGKSNPAASKTVVWCAVCCTRPIGPFFLRDASGSATTFKGKITW